MSKFTIFSLLTSLAMAMPITAQADEKATYVGEGRYVGEDRSVDSAVLQQRNNEWTQRQSDRERSEERYERIERREREYDRERQKD